MKKGYIIRFQNSRLFKSTTIFTVISFLVTIFYPTQSYALTGGGGQQEFGTFSQAGDSEMVDLYSGDFKYNIPLLSVPGPNGSYPLNLSYHSGISMEEEASWTGLGWNVNVGAINRQLRGLPDDFKGDEVIHKMHIKPSTTVSYEIPMNMMKMELSSKTESFGFPVYDDEDDGIMKQLQSMNCDLYYNTYKGLGLRASMGVKLGNQYNSLNVGLTYDTQGGLELTPSYSCGGKFANVEGGVTLRTGEGVSGFNVGAGVNVRKTDEKLIKTTGSKSTSISFGVNQSTPSVTLPMKTNVVPFKVSIGKSDYLGHYNAKGFLIINGSVTHSKVAKGGIVKSSAYGYLHSHEGIGNENNLLDVSRNNVKFTKEAPYLSPANFNYDIFTYSGQGTGGSFRPHQSSVLTLGERKASSETSVHKGVVEVGPGGTSLHIGLGYTHTSGNASSGVWKTGISSIKEKVNRVYEQAYFLEGSEMTGNLKIDDEYEQWKQKSPYRLNVIKGGSNWMKEDYTMENNLINSSLSNSNSFSFDGNNIGRTSRKTRAKHIKALTSLESKTYGFSRFVELQNPDLSYIKDDHIKEMVVNQEDGMKYIYAQPNYNKKQYEVISSIAPQNGPYKNYVDVNETSYLDKESIQYLSRKELPSYAHSWMLSYVVSSDYIDVDQNGPSNADFGYWVKFEYEQKSSNFKWRSPYKGASYIEGYLTDKTDDMGAYTYGEKELVYLKSISTKTHTAKFIISPRADAREATSEYAKLESIVGEGKSYQLDQIDLYTNEELYSKKDAKKITPIKRVHFTYNYDLCPNVENNSGEVVADDDAINQNRGKLTLQKVHFTYQNSARGELSPYVFHYQNNKKYNKDNIDRWGNFKSNINEDGTTTKTSSYAYQRFPYTSQEFEIVDGKKVPKETIAPWTLNKIDLPSGGTFEVEYESDDYAYTEDKQATRMYDVIGVGQQSLSDFKSLGDFSPVEIKNKVDSDRRMYFKLEESIEGTISQSVANNYFKKNYMEGLDKVWYKSLVQLRDGKYEYVSGYVGLELEENNYGVIKGSDGNYSIGFIMLKPLLLNPNGFQNSIHPITKQSIQFLQVERPDLIRNDDQTITLESTSALKQIKNFLKSTVKIFPDLLQVFTGYNRFAYSVLNTGNKIQLGGNTIIKLKDGDGYKFGGGIRVKRFTLKDNWVNGSKSDNSTYGQEYDYTITEDGRTISSGVAYEPQVGGEESALRNSVEFKQQAILGTEKTFTIDKPLLESYYPGASVGYRKVTVRSIAPKEAEKAVTSNKLFGSAAPITVYEYYSPKDFPVLTDVTDLNQDNTLHRPIIIPLFYSQFNKRLARSQGYSIVLNDMAGKLKSVSMYTRGYTSGEIVSKPTLISKKEYNYQTINPYNEYARNELKNEVDVYIEDKINGVKKTQANIGQTIDMFVDQNNNIESTTTKGLEIDLDVQTVPAYPFWILPTPELSDTEFSDRFSVTMKIINRKGILKEVIETTEKSVIKTENLIFDASTGEALLSKVTNEFNEPIYSMNFPAHWYYEDGMGHAYTRDNLVYNENLLSMNSGLITGFTSFTSIDDNFFTIGDEILVVGLTGEPFRAFVIDKSDKSIKIMTPSGENITDGGVKGVGIINPSRKNMISTKVGNITFKSYSEDANHKPLFDQIINASALTLSDDWLVSCQIPGLVNQEKTYRNPYMIGKKGRYKIHQTFSFVTERKYSKKNNKDGVYSDFNPFPWRTPLTKNSKWVLVNESTLFSNLGFQLEGKNALNIYSSSVLGYNGSLPVAVAGNAQFKEIGFDGFEDYKSNVRNSHFGFNRYYENISNEQSHSGKKSIKVMGGKSVKMKKPIGVCSSTGTGTPFPIENPGPPIFPAQNSY